MGECLAPGKFRVVDFTVDHGGGTVATFMRSIRSVVLALTRFFDRTEHDYRRFNYLGEWHSHPSFKPTPSIQDISTVQSIADDPGVGANFVALVILKLRVGEDVQGSATVFRPSARPERARLIFRGRHEEAQEK